MNCSILKEDTKPIIVGHIEQTSFDNNIKNEALTTYKCGNSDEIQIKSELFNSSDTGKLGSENEVLHLGKAENKELKYDFSLKNLPEDYKESYATYINEVKEIATIPVIKSIPDDYIKNFKHFNLRYYEDKYCINFGVSEDGYCDINIRIHTNKLTLVALASGNDIIQNRQPIVYISFIINCNDRSNVCLTGKKKKGSKVVEQGTILCQVKCEGDDKLYNIRSGVCGRIIEINEHIKARPDLLRTDPKGVGFIAVLAPKGKELVMPKNLLSEEEYMHYMMGRPPKYHSNSVPTTSRSDT